RAVAPAQLLPRPVRTWTLTKLREKLIKIGAKVVHHARAVTFQLAEGAVPRALFAAILARIGRVRAAPSPGWSVGAGAWARLRAEEGGDGLPCGEDGWPRDKPRWVVGTPGRASTLPTAPNLAAFP